MANYSSTLSIAYQQLVPSLKWAPTLNQAWDKANGKGSSIAFHAYNRNMYFRDLNYKKFASRSFYATDGTPQLKAYDYLALLGMPRMSPSTQKYSKKISSSDQKKFYQVVTMQNHMPYEDFYPDNQF